MHPAIAPGLRSGLFLTALLSTALVLPERHDTVRVTVTDPPSLPSSLPEPPVLELPALPDLAAAAHALELDELSDVTLRVTVGATNPDWIAISNGTAIAVSRDGGQQFQRLAAPASAELPTIWFDGRGRLLVQNEGDRWTDAHGQLVPVTSHPLGPEPAPMLEVDDDETVRWRSDAGWLPVRGLPTGEVDIVDSPWPALHVAGGIYEIVAGIAQWRLAVPGPYEDGDLINAVSIDRAGRVWVTEYSGGGDCDGSERLVVAGLIAHAP